VGAIVAGRAIAQEPQILPGLTVDQAAADDATLVRCSCRWRSGR
jgi:hypothetical protein